MKQIRNFTRSFHIQSALNFLSVSFSSYTSPTARVISTRWMVFCFPLAPSHTHHDNKMHAYISDCECDFLQMLLHDIDHNRLLLRRHTRADHRSALGMTDGAEKQKTSRFVRLQTSKQRGRRSREAERREKPSRSKRKEKRQRGGARKWREKRPERKREKLPPHRQRERAKEQREKREKRTERTAR